MSPHPSVIVFDVNETLSDMNPMAGRFPGIAALRTVLRGIDLNRDLDAAIGHVMDGFAQLAVHPDVPDGGLCDLPRVVHQHPNDVRRDDLLRRLARFIADDDALGTPATTRPGSTLVSNTTTGPSSSGSPGPLRGRRGDDVRRRPPAKPIGEAVTIGGNMCRCLPYRFSMKRLVVGAASIYLLFAVIGRFVEGMGAVRCECRPDCWCKKPGVSLFRWVFPAGHSLGADRS